MTDWPDIVRRYGPLVWSTAYRLLGREADAADCFQETFLSAVKLARQQRVDNSPALLQRLAASRALDRLRVRVRERARTVVLTEATIGSGAGPVHEAESRELADRLREALTQLPSQQSEAFCLHCV